MPDPTCPSSEITIRFASDEAMMAFCTWLCDGGGEQDFFRSIEIHAPDHAVGRMQYHSENEEYARDDARRYGPFMADRLIIAHPEKPTA